MACFGWGVDALPFNNTIDYCDPSICGDNTTNVACTSNKGFGPTCVNATQVDLTAFQQMIVDRHNMRRSQTATGNLTGFPSASNMLEMVNYVIHKYKKYNIYVKIKLPVVGR